MFDEEGFLKVEIAKKLKVDPKTISRWFKARDEADAPAVQELAVGPDIVLPLPAPTPPVMSGTNGYRLPEVTPDQ